jgi:hypothetical protein
MKEQTCFESEELDINRRECVGMNTRRKKIRWQVVSFKNWGSLPVSGGGFLRHNINRNVSFCNHI